MHLDSFKQQLVLIGGGHANVQVLRKLCMNSYRGLHTILINSSSSSIYSGMTPGYIENTYSLDEISIDLQRLCFNAGATFINDEVIKLDIEKKEIFLKNRPIINFDLLSINTGSISKNSNIKIHDEAKYLLVKPIGLLVKKMHYIDKLLEKKSNPVINIIGGGVAAFEISFALFNRYGEKLSLNIISPNTLTEKNLNSKTIKELKKTSQNMNIQIKIGSVNEIQKTEILLSSGEMLPSDLSLLSTGTELPEWILNSSLKINNGSISVKSDLQSLSDSSVFAAGDVVNIEGYQRAKSGVMAVRQGQVLKENLFLKFQGKKLKKIKPQKNWLYIIGTEKNKALLNYYQFSFHNKWCWHLKKWIDKYFMKKFIFPNKLSMQKKIHFIKNFHSKENTMFCQGCGSKVSKNSLTQYLAKENQNSELADSSFVQIKENKILQTIDHIKLFNSLDPYQFGVISYLHSKNDIVASGGVVHSFNVSIGVPYSEKYSEKFFLEFFMEGIKKMSDIDNSYFASGHSYQSNEPGITIGMNGVIEKETNKKLAKENDLIYLSKPLGIGYLLAAYYQNSELLNYEDFNKILTFLKCDNQNAVKAGRVHNIKVMTDISGFGLASHLGDICDNSKLTARVDLTKEILINSNFEILKNYKSTGFHSNFKSVSKYVDVNINNPYQNILYDPQTNGPMLLIVDQNYKKDFERTYKEFNNTYPILIGKFEAKGEYLIKINQ